MSNNYYRPIEGPELEKEVSSFSQIIIDFILSNGYEQNDVFIDETSVAQIITRVNKRKQYFQYFHHLNLSDLKELGLYCFWIIKLRPLSRAGTCDTPDKKSDFESVNEKFAIYNIIAKLRSLMPNDEERVNQLFNEKYIYELLYSFTYRDISKEAMILLIETMAIALGLNPYNPQ